MTGLRSSTGSSPWGRSLCPASSVWVHAATASVARKPPPVMAASARRRFGPVPNMWCVPRLLRGPHRLREARQEHAARKPFREYGDGAARLLRAACASERPHAQRLAFLRQASRRESSGMLRDQHERAEKVATGVRDLSALQKLELGRIGFLGIDWPCRAARLRDRERPRRD